MKIVLDTLGGDHPPQELIAGGIAAAKEYDVHIIFAGDEKLIQQELQGKSGFSYAILHAPEEIIMEDAPSEAVRKKQNSSLVQGIRAVRKHEADAFVSPANTGAVMAGALFNLGRIHGIDRPGLGVVLPTLEGHRRTLMVDVGANADCSPENLLQFAIMGNVYAREILNVAEPKIGLLNIGEEPQKGDAQTLKAFSLLQQELRNFRGNVESNRVLEGGYDVVVCDGFTGNICVKAYEGAAHITVEFLKRAIKQSLLAKIGVPFLLPAMRHVKRETSAAEVGGAPLLGVKGIVIIAHGNSNAEAIKNAIRVAKNAVEHRVIQKIERGIRESLIHLGMLTPSA
ncbi:phosphate acyltransferase PlsX [Candidatus Acetothermia bacterium]|nr:phosphate acyltransferase PlsX [Candidatus Acetothermia bacterium]